MAARAGRRFPHRVGMKTEIAERMAAQHGLLLRRQVLAAGVAPAEVDLWVRRGDWTAVRRGVYATTAFWESLDRYRGQPLLEARAACLNMVMPHLMSHDSAALVHGLSMLRPHPRLVHITRFGVLGSRTRCGVKHHKAPFNSDQIDFVDDLPVLDAARTAVDVAREHGLPHGLSVCDSALRHGVRRSDLIAAYEPWMRNWPGVRTVRKAVELADRGAENPGESLTRLLVLELGLGRIETQFGLRDAGREAFCDLRIGRHIIEFDGRIKYQRDTEGGVAVVRPDEVVWLEKQRQDWVCGFKLGMSRVVWADLSSGQREVTKRRLLREILDTNARFGVSIGDLAPYVVRRR
jgi:hypothetical protein